MSNGAEHHIVSPKVYGTIFGALLVGTALTVFAAFQDLGKWNIVVALGIATIKASLVVLFFMHAKYSPGRTQIVVIAAVFWLAIMLALTLTDYTTRPLHEGRMILPTNSSSALLNV
jgi:cytochrome c oxidase subunit IV